MKTDKAITTRYEPEVYAAVTTAAQTEDRSYNKMVNILLKEAIAARQEKVKKK